MSEPIFYDRTRTALDKKCRRRRFWAFEFGGKGISLKKKALALDVGIVLHDSLASLLLGEELEKVVLTARTYVFKALMGGTTQLVDEPGWKVEEQQAMIEGMIRGWARFVLPRLLAEYTVIKVEGEVLYDHDGCRLGSKPDVLLERDADGALFYIEWKSTAMMGTRFFTSWHRAVQLPAGALGVAQTLGRELAGSIVFALSKGRLYRKTMRQESIFAYGYGLPSDPNNLTYKYRKGLWRHPVWEIMPVKRWVDEMPDDVLSTQFGDTGTIFTQPHLVQAWLRQNAIREKEIRAARDTIFGGENRLTLTQVTEILDRVFPQNFDECDPAIGAKCDFCDCCHLEHVGRDPLGSGLYIPREPHHTTDPDYDSGED